MNQGPYSKMYATLCGAVSDAIDALQDPHNGIYARSLLEKAILHAEELYVSWEEEGESEE